jgi:DNA-binding TFAR19-related protein (PDSD5 family)
MRITVVGAWSEIDVPGSTDVRETARRYKEITEQIDTLKAEQERLGRVLVEEQVNEWFEDGTKVVYQQGRTKSKIDDHKIIAELSYDELLKVVKIQEKDLKALARPGDTNFGKRVLEEHKQEIGRGDPSVRVARMTKQELKEHGLGG